MTSYQQRKRDIEYYQQCVHELEDMCLRLAAQIPGDIVLPLGGGVTGDQFMTPYNCDDGSFYMQLMVAQRIRR